MSVISWKTTYDKEAEREANANNLVIVDMINIAHRVGSSVKDGKAFARKMMEDIQHFSKEYDARKTILLTDKGKSSFRVELLPEYKANRKANREKLSEAEQRAKAEWFEKMKEGIRIVEEEMKIFGYKGVEADDLASVIVQTYSETEEFDHIWLISTDGDWDTLLSEVVSRYSFYTKREYRLEDMYENSGVDTPEQFASLKALQGDIGDNITGIDGIGAKRGYGLLREYGTAMDIYDALPLPGKQKFIASLNAGADVLFRNIQLVDLISFSAEALEHAGVLNQFKQELEEYLHD